MRSPQVFGPAAQSRLEASNLLRIEGPTLVVRVTAPAMGGSELGGMPESSRARALVDTGANVNGIDMRLAERLGLPLADHRPLFGPNSRRPTPVYVGKLNVPNLGYNVQGEFFGLDLRGSGQGFDVLLGRLFLSQFLFTYDGPSGTFHFARPFYSSSSDA